MKRTKSNKASLNRSLVIALAILLVRTFGCDGSGCSGGCSGGCGSGGCGDPIPGGYPEAEKIPDSVQVRLTPNAFKFLEDNIDTLINAFIPGGLSFDIPETTTNVSVLGDITICPGGCNGVTATISDAQFQMIPKDEMDVTIYISSIDDQNPSGDDKLTIPVESSLVNCDVDAWITDPNPGMPVTAQVLFSIDPSTDYLQVEIGQIDADMDKLDFAFSGGGMCSVLDALKGLFRSMIEDQLKSALNDQLGGVINEYLCMSCEQADNCPAGSACDGKYCMSQATGKCVPTPLGVVGEVDMGALVASMSPSTQSRVWVHDVAGGYVEVTQGSPNPGGLNVGVIGGMKAPTHSACVPKREQPPSPAIQKVALGDDNPHTGHPVSLAAVIARAFMDDALYELYDSGFFCLTISSDATELLSSDTLGLILGQEFSEHLSKGENLPMAIAIRPRQVPRLTIGEGTFATCDGGCPDNSSCDDASGFCLTSTGFKVPDDPLLTVAFKELNLDFYAFVSERYVRLFTLQADVTAPIGLEVLGDDSLQPVLGDLAFDNLTISNNKILGKSTEQLQADFPAIIDLALGFATSALSPIAMPELAPGLSLRVDGIHGEAEGIDPETQETTYTALGVYADFVTKAPPPPVSSSAMDRVNTRAEVVSVHFEHDQGSIPGVEVRAGGPGLEWQASVDGRAWTFFTPSEKAVVKSGTLLAEGRHEILVRARRIAEPGTLDPTPVELYFTIDRTPPSMVLRLDEDSVLVEVRDRVASRSEIELKYRWDDESWRPVSNTRSIGTRGLSPGVHVLHVYARDPAGHEARAVKKVRVDNRATPGGCSATGDQGHGFTGVLLLLAAVLLLSRRKRNDSVSATLLVLFLAALPLVSISCGDTPGDTKGDSDVDADTDVDTDVDADSDADGDCTCNWECRDNMLCVDGKCVSQRCKGDEECCENWGCNGTAGICYGLGLCTDDEQCLPEQHCSTQPDPDEETRCKFTPCSTDSDCFSNQSIQCPGGSSPTCYTAAGVCICSLPCGGACGKGQYCCMLTGKCMKYPPECADKECPEGKIGVELKAGEFDPNTCAYQEPECACMDLPPLPLGIIGRYADMECAGQGIWVAAYNDTYGDLVVGRGDPDTGMEWTFVDGYPGTGTPVASPSGPRNGIEEPGPDVGKYASLAVGSDGLPRVAYYDSDGKDLKYAYFDGNEWHTMVVDQEGDVGRFASLALEADDTPVIAYMLAEKPTLDGAAAKVAIARGPDAAEWDIYEADSVELKPPPCSRSCGQGEKCIEVSGRETCVIPTQDCGDCGSDVCYNGSCEKELKESTLADLPDGTGLFNSLEIGPDGSPVLVFYERSRMQATDNGLENVRTGDLKLAQWNGSGFDVRTLADGRSGDRDGDVGRYPSLAITPSGGILVAYQDASLGNLRFLDLEAGTDAVVDDGLRTAGGEVVAIDRVGADASLVLFGGTPFIAYQDQTDLALMLARKDQGAWTYEAVFADDQDNHGFFADLCVSGTNLVGMGFSYRLKSTPARSGLEFFTK